MEGSIEDIWGNSYSGGGTYDVYVARKLKLYTGMLPTTPFEAGDSFAPTVQVYPRLPAEIEMDFKLFRDSDPGDLYSRPMTGTANDFGYFHPGSGFEPITLPGGGEYRVDITATYNDPDGTLWMGTTSWGNVVENTDTPLIGHGVRGTDHPDINKLWFFHKNTGFSGITHTNYPYYAGDIFYPYYAGDIFWGEESDEAADIGGDAIMPMVSIQDTGGEVYDILRERWETRVHGMIEMHGGLEEAIQRGEVQLFSTTSTMWDLSWDPGSIDQYGYTYRSSQRPGARVHESLSEGGIPIAYWRYGATYGDQVGIEGDRPNDLKWQFGGAVFRDLKSNITHYAIYGSLWVLVPENDPLGPRVTPPFQGATGGPNGGPILTLKGKEIDLLFLPKSGAPGQIMQVGESFSFSGHVGPPLDSKLNVTITSPSGSTRVITGQANKIGYFYQPSDDFVVDEPGVWTVVVQVVHEGMTSAGPVGPPYPTGDVLGSEEGLYHFYVLPQGSSPIQLESPSPGFLKITDSPQAMEITGQIPSGMDDPSVHYTIAMPGTILEEGTASPSAGVFTVTYDPVRLHQDFPNLDLTAYNAYRPGLADQIWISILVGDASGQYAACSITLHGEEVFER
jgi:hypothetical protein